MLAFFNKLKKYKVPIILLALLFLTSWFLLKKSQHQENTVEPYNTQNNAQEKPSPIMNDQEKTPANISSKTLESAAPSISNPQTFSFQKESHRINELIKDLPQSKNELLKVILEKDPYKDQKAEVKAHTTDEINQNQMGAIKVLALKALMSQDISPDLLKKDLDHIIEKANDPTIVKIAKEAKNSINDGRSLFEDFPKGIQSLSH